MDMQAEASVFESVQPSVTVLTALGDEDNWSCPICFDLLYKPCANACGHVFCFW